MKPASRRHNSVASLALAVLLFTAGAAEAQTYAVDRAVLGGGGGTSTNAQFSVTGTIGQPVATVSLGVGPFILDSGFWSLAIAVQTPGAPMLRVARTGNSLIVSWNLPADGFTLEVADQLESATTIWQAVATVPLIADNQRSVTLPLQPGARYFRLKRFGP